MGANQPITLITGASSGIGAATARLLAQKGHSLVLAARRAEQLAALAAELTSQGAEALSCPTDVSDPASIDSLVHSALQHFGRIDVLFNNAGVIYVDWLEKLTIEEILAQLQINSFGVIATTRAVVPHMIERRAGLIINMISLAGLVAAPTYSVYSASKFAVRGFTDALRREVSPYGVRVSAIYPGGVVTDLTRLPSRKRVTTVTSPRALVLTPDQVAQAVWRLVNNPRRAIVLPEAYRLVVWLEHLAPGLLDWIIRQRYHAGLRQG